MIVQHRSRPAVWHSQIMELPNSWISQHAVTTLIAVVLFLSAGVFLNRRRRRKRFPGRRPLEELSIHPRTLCFENYPFHCAKASSDAIDASEIDHFHFYSRELRMKSGEAVFLWVIPPSNDPTEEILAFCDRNQIPVKSGFDVWNALLDEMVFQKDLSHPEDAEFPGWLIEVGFSENEIRGIRKKVIEDLGKPPAPFNPNDPPEIHHYDLLECYEAHKKLTPGIFGWTMAISQRGWTKTAIMKRT